MRFKSMTAALLCGATLFAAAGAEAADGFATQLYLKTDLGPQAIAADTALDAGSQVRLVVVANEDMTVSVRWQPAGSEAQSLVSDVALAKGRSLAVPGPRDWIELGAGDGREAFLVFSTDAAGNVEQEQVAYVILDESVAALDQATFGNFARTKAQGKATPLSGFATPLAGFSAFATGDFTGNKATGFAAQLAKVPPEPPTFSSSGANLFKKVADGVVLVLTNEGLGSGSLITAGGEILTNWHVVKGYSVVGVVFRPPQGTPLSEDMIVLADVVKISETQDLALLQLQQPPAGGVVLQLGSMANVDIGNEVHAVGHPRGESWTYTRGYVSQIRDAYVWDIGEGVQHNGQVIQTQTPINPGNSGGPLFDDDGTVIGVNTFIQEQADGLNYAVSVGEVERFLAAQIADNTQPSQPSTPTPAPVAGQPTPPTPPSPPPAADAGEPEFFPIDDNGNGTPDAYGADRNGDGYYDIIVLDEDEDGVPEAAYFDDNFNGIVDVQVVVTADAQGPFDLWMFDDDEDGKADRYGFDWDQDGTIDEWSEA